MMKGSDLYARMPADQLLEAVSVGLTTLTCDVAYAAGCICTAYIVIASAA